MNNLLLDNIRFIEKFNNLNNFIKKLLTLHLKTIKTKINYKLQSSFYKYQLLKASTLKHEVIKKI